MQKNEKSRAQTQLCATEQKKRARFIRCVERNIDDDDDDDGDGIGIGQQKLRNDYFRWFCRQRRFQRHQFFGSDSSSNEFFCLSCFFPLNEKKLRTGSFFFVSDSGVLWIKSDCHRLFIDCQSTVRRLTAVHWLFKDYSSTVSWLSFGSSTVYSLASTQPNQADKHKTDNKQEKTPLVRRRASNWRWQQLFIEFLCWEDCQAEASSRSSSGRAMRSGSGRLGFKSRQNFLFSFFFCFFKWEASQWRLNFEFQKSFSIKNMHFSSFWIFSLFLVRC